VELLDNMKISKQVQDIVDKSNKPFDIIKGLSFNYRETINRIYFYKNDKFVECSDENAIFWNVVKPYIMHFAKNIDLDTKDFRAVGRGQTNYAQSWILDIRFKKWADENNLSIKIDDLTQLVSEFGSFVWKLCKNDDGNNDIEPCDLRNLYFDPSVSSIRKTAIVEKHYLTDDEIREKADVWDNTEEIITKANEDEDNKEFERKEIWEFTGWIGTGKERKYKHIFGAGYGDAEVIAFEEELEPEDNKYFDFHLDKFSGTWLRKGAYQTNFILQERANTLINQEADATAIASLLLLRSEDPNTKGNVLQGAISGQIINSRDLQQIAVDNRAAGTLMNGIALIEAQVRKNLLLPDVATGDELPSGTTFRGQAMMSNAYKSAFKQMRNRIAEPLKDIIGEHILPDLVKDWNREELIELAGSEADIEMYDEAVKTLRKLQLVEQKNMVGEPIMPGELEQLDADTEQQLGRTGRKIEIGKKFFNFEYGFSIDPVGESFDKAQQNEAIVNAIQMEAMNPAISDSPRFKQLLENNGINQSPLKPQVKTELTMNNQGQSMPQVQSLSSVVDTASI
jgi:hypothetical protein